MMFTQAVLALVLLGHASAAWAVPFLALRSTLTPRGDKASGHKVLQIQP